jgi:hypothetical protein
MDEQLLEKTRLLSGAGLFMAIHRLNCIWSCVAFFLLPTLPSMTMIQRQAKKPNDYYARARAREAKPDQSSFSSALRAVSVRKGNHSFMRTALQRSARSASKAGSTIANAEYTPRP